jgi:hypothetical protein
VNSFSPDVPHPWKVDCELKVICVVNEPGRLADHQQGRAARFESAYPLTVGRSYAVVGMSITETVLYFLVRDDHGEPRFAPAGMFDLVTSPLPAGWCFALGSGVRASGRDLWIDPVVATWGYPELVEDPAHFTALLDEDVDASAIFTRHVADGERPDRPDRSQD